MAQVQKTQQGHPAMDYPEHERTYQGFIALVKWGTIFSAITLILMAVFLV
jgi:hypothetical protein